MSLMQAREKYGDYDIYITHKNKEKIADYLIEQGIEAGNIINMRGKEHYLSCSNLEHNCIIDQSKIFFCCPQYEDKRLTPAYELPNHLKNKNLASFVSEWIKVRDETIQNLKTGKLSLCDGCTKLSIKWWPVKKKLNCITLSA